MVTVSKRLDPCFDLPRPCQLLYSAKDLHRLIMITKTLITPPIFKLIFIEF